MKTCKCVGSRGNLVFQKVKTKTAIDFEAHAIRCMNRFTSVNHSKIYPFFLRYVIFCYKSYLSC